MMIFFFATLALHLGVLLWLVCEYGAVAWKEIVCDDTLHTNTLFYFIINEPIHGKSDGCFCLFDTDIYCRQK